MDKSKVYFTDFRAKPGYNLLQKLQRLMKQAGIENIDFNNKYVAIKLHFGEPGNLSFLRPNYAWTPLIQSDALILPENNIQSQFFPYFCPSD